MASPMLVLAVLVAWCGVLVMEVSGQESKCMGDLGCFTSDTVLAVLPLDEEAIGTQFFIYSRANRDNKVVLNATSSESEWLRLVRGSHFDASKDTKVITHGWQDQGMEPWVQQMKAEFLKKGDFNVICVNWKQGASHMIDVASANVFVVAAQVSKFLKSLHAHVSLDYSKLHLVGHSLGAHISGKVGALTHGITRVTGLDPAEPFFVSWPNARRLDKSDAKFVDIIHSDGEKFSITKGFGLIDALGHIDFYPNGGIDQPGCSDDVLSGILGLLQGNTQKGLHCSHGRAVSYFIESINSGCHFKARPCADWATYEQGGCKGCPSQGCPLMGYDADKSAARGSFYVSTAPQAPYCGTEYHVEIDMGHHSFSTTGRLNITLLGTRNSLEGEFSRDYEHVESNEAESHVIAVNHLAGSVSGVRLHYHKRSGQAHVYVRKVIVEDLDRNSRVTFCAQDVEILNDHPVEMTSTSGC